MIQDIVTSFSITMTWLVLLLCLVAIMLLGLAAWYLPQNRRRALFGVILMALVVLAAGGSFLFLSHKAQSLARLLLPLATPLLLVSLYRLSFPPLDPVSAARSDNRHHVLFFLLTLSALITTAGLVLLDLLFL